MNGLRKAALVAGFAAVVGSLCPASALEMRPILTLDVARKIVDGCLARAQQQGWKMHIAVIDIGGNLKAFMRMDDAQLISEEVAMRKAYTAAALPRSTRETADLAYGNPERRPGGIAFLSRVAVIQGGLPIMTAGGVHIGGVGVSGSTAQNDEACAQAGLDAVKDDMK
jgi:glc operon protein GlcG